MTNSSSSRNQSATKAKPINGDSASLQLTELIRQERQHHAVTLEELSRLSGLTMEETQEAISQPTHAPLANLYAIANALNLNPEIVLDLLNMSQDVLNDHD
ncbi:MAG TPA: helix-turn-helix transcriptional regulator [Pseudobdellovibrionaceae bacterium]|nr:helix-turn-helix transcriptional regulator [Pseudobdellovibrionaceae bacterium]